MIEVFRSSPIRRMTTGGNYVNLTADVVLHSDHVAALATARREALEEALAAIRPWKKRDHLSLHAGEVTAQEFRTVVAVLISIEGSLRALPLDIGGGDAT